MRGVVPARRVCQGISYHRFAFNLITRHPPLSSVAIWERYSNIGKWMPAYRCLLLLGTVVAHHEVRSYPGLLTPSNRCQLTTQDQNYVFPQLHSAPMHACCAFLALCCAARLHARPHCAAHALCSLVRGAIVEVIFAQPPRRHGSAVTVLVQPPDAEKETARVTGSWGGTEEAASTCTLWCSVAIGALVQGHPPEQVKFLVL